MIKSLLKNKKRSFPALLPYMEYVDESAVFLLEDGVSYAISFDISQIATEGRSDEYLAAKRDDLQTIFQESIPLLSNPWIVQEFSYIEPNLADIVDNMKKLATRSALDSKYSKFYFELMKKHLDFVVKEDGFFIDELTQKPFNCGIRKTKIIFYKRIDKTERLNKHEPLAEIIELRDRLEQAFLQKGLKFSKDTGKTFFLWMLKWFNPEFSKNELIKMANFDLNNLPFGLDLSESLILSEPSVDTKNGIWTFGNILHKFIRIERLIKEPAIGQLTGEISSTHNALTKCFLDGLPSGSIVCKTAILSSQTAIKTYLETLSSKTQGGSSAVLRASNALDELTSKLGLGQNICRMSIGIYVKAHDFNNLKQNINQVATSLLNNNLVPFRGEEDELAAHAYIAHLPMNFKPYQDVKNYYQRLSYTQHMVNLSPLWGRETGSVYPGMLHFNRGGAPICFDLFNNDRKTNAHTVVIGNTGAGKSVYLANLMAQTAAIYRPRMFVIDAGGSFATLANFFKTLDLTVNYIKITPKDPPSIPPFAESHLLFLETLDTVIDENFEDDANDEQRDIIGEMESSALIMITGGEQNEYLKYGRPERGMLRQGILNAAKLAYEQKRQMLTEDLRDALFELAKTQNIMDELKIQLQKMANAINSFTIGFDGELFNRPGVYFKEADLTIVDMGVLAKEGYDTQLALTYTSLMSKVYNIAEREQHKGRQTILISDECHLYLQKQLTALIAIKIVKMFRKLFTWAIFATQNIDDFSGTSKKLLNMCEWWVILQPTKNEIEQISTFKTLTQTQKDMMQSLHKQKGAYTEGVVLSSTLPELLIRSIPPSLFLALCMTEGEEKKMIFDLMQEFNCDAVEAAFIVAKRLDIKRGFINE